jgi:hypothetical protein
MTADPMAVRCERCGLAEAPDDDPQAVGDVFICDAGPDGEVDLCLGCVADLRDHGQPIRILAAGLLWGTANPGRINTHHAFSDRWDARRLAEEVGRG